jgi:Lon protease-like protein
VWVSYRLAELLPLSGAEKQQLLAEDDTNARLAQLKAAMEYHGIIEKINKIN